MPGLNKGKKPVFNMRKYTYAMSKELARRQIAFRNAAQQDDVNADQIIDLNEDVLELIFGVVESLPESWTIEGTPEDVNWGDKNTALEWIQGHRLLSLVEAFNAQAKEGN